MSILASWSRTQDRSFSLPSTRIASAALARPGPIEAAMSAPLSGFSNDRTDPSGKETLIMVATTHEDSERSSPADTKCRRRQAGKRHKGARPAGSSSDGGGGWGGEEPAVPGGGGRCGPDPRQISASAPDPGPT